MVKKVLSLHKAGNRLTQQSFLDEDEEDPDLLEHEDDESLSDTSRNDPYERIGQIFKYFPERKAFTAVDGLKKISNKYRNELKEFLKTVTDRFFSNFFPNRTMKTQADYKDKIKELAMKVCHLFCNTYTKSFF
jgi:predicted AlkP superfamily pyrophosphatase or phosphodiesterase